MNPRLYFLTLNFSLFTPLLRHGKDVLPRRIRALVDHDGSLELDHDGAVLLETAGLDEQDADVGARLGLALVQHFCFGIERVARIDGRWKANLIPTEICEGVLAHVDHAHPRDKRQRE